MLIRILVSILTPQEDTLETWVPPTHNPQSLCSKGTLYHQLLFTWILILLSLFLYLAYYRPWASSLTLPTTLVMFGISKSSVIMIWHIWSCPSQKKNVYNNLHRNGTHVPLHFISCKVTVAPLSIWTLSYCLIMNNMHLTMLKDCISLPCISDWFILWCDSN